MTLIQLAGLTKVFSGPKGEDVRALDGVDLDVADGEMVVLLGPSGCGKTTLLRCVAGLEQPTVGRIVIGDTVMYSDRDRVEVAPDRRDLGMVFQSYALWPHMSVADNVAYPLKRRHVPRSEQRERVRAALMMVDCGHLADRYPHELSGGQQQRVSLARALVASPRVLLFDEPLSNLDAGLRDRMRSEIRDVQRRIACTSVYVTHDQREAMAIADRLIVMRGGRILQQGTPEQVYARPTTAFVADFLGAANVIPVDRRLEHDHMQTPVGAVRVSVGADVTASEDVSIVVRQESISLVNGHQPAGANVIDARLVNAEFLGDHRLALFESRDVQLRAKLPIATRLEPGAAYKVSFPVESAHLVTA